MDWGVFHHRGWRFGLLLLAPLLLTAAVYGATHVYSDSVREGLARRRAYIQVLPSLYRSLLQVERLNGSLAALDRAGVGSEEELNALLYEVADEAGLTLDSLTISLAEADEETGPAPTLVVEIQGSGTLVAQMKFFRAVQLQDPVVLLDDARMLATRREPEPWYEATYVLQYGYPAP